MSYWKRPKALMRHNADSQLLGYRDLALLDGSHTAEGQKIVATLSASHRRQGRSSLGHCT